MLLSRGPASSTFIQPDGTHALSHSHSSSRARGHTHTNRQCMKQTKPAEPPVTHVPVLRIMRGSWNSGCSRLGRRRGGGRACCHLREMLPEVGDQVVARLL
jgi:hypothetical protein